MATATEPIVEPRPIPDVFSIQGKKYHRPTSTTLEQDAFVEVRLRDSGIKKQLKGFDLKTGDIGDLVEAVILEAFDRGVMYEILGGIFVPVGEPWSRAGALRTARAIAENADEEEKRVIFTFAAEVLFDFFKLAAVFLPTSQSSSRSTMTPGLADAGGDLRAGTESLSHEPSDPSAALRSTTTGRGTTSSESSPDGM